MPASILLPDQEARRYILGIFHILVIVAIGFDVLLLSLIPRASKVITTEIPIFRRFNKPLTVAISLIVMLAFVIFFALENRSHFNNWVHGRAKWHFDYELTSAGKYLQTLRDSQVDDFEVRLYSIRWQFDHVTLKYLVPNLQGVNGDEKFGGDGTALSGGELKGDTVFLLLDKYLEQDGLAEEIEASYPGGDWHRQFDEDGKPLYAAYMIVTQ